MGKRQTVLVVSSEAQEVQRISSLMEKVDFNVVTAAEKGESIDLAIVDVNKTDAEAAVLNSLHERFPKIRLVLMSSNGDANNVGPAGHTRRVLCKPVRKARLLGTVVSLMDAPLAKAASEA